jgi:hypothetical protein
MSNKWYAEKSGRECGLKVLRKRVPYYKCKVRAELHGKGTFETRRQLCHYLG